ncbi:MAG: T9SS type A sorting domain-containing protein, partial [Chitinophagales bacterium]|nr:T9SS type A sorting domain-containing protein [Chitinophagales bacterium]
IDTTRLYTKGTSANGFGAILMASIFPEKIAAVYDNVEPFAVSPVSDTYKQMWGESATELKSDILDWQSGDALTLKKITHFIKMMNVNEQRSMPPIFDVHGKNDVTVTWNADKVEWLDSLNQNHIGGAWYWDQRDHGGSGKNFDDEEMEPNYYRFATNISYPAFSNCSINQNPGNGNKKDGDDYGTYNGYLDFVDDNIADKTCSYLIHVFIKDFYVGGVLDVLQYLTCTTDITFRRLQNFQPPIGSTIKWKNFDDVTNLKIQSGSFTYNGGLITLTDLTVSKTGNRIKLRIANCTSKLGDDDSDNDDSMVDESVVNFSKTSAGYMAHLESAIDQSIDVSVYDLLGRTISVKRINLQQGINDFEITAPLTGIYLVEVKNQSFHYTEKLMF